MDASRREESGGGLVGSEPRFQPTGHPPSLGVTRIAPSPTGALHLGNARTFAVNWLLARQRHWRIVLRIEDLDGPRVRSGADQQAIELLEWLGLDWDEGPVYQSADLKAYARAMDVLASKGLVYPSDATRAQIAKAASAPHGGHETRCGPEFRPPALPTRFDDETSSWRFAAPERMVAFDDEVAGSQRFRPFDEVGDFVVWTRRREPAYQLAVVVDDDRQGITHIVRGDDLLPSTARQILLRQALGLGPGPSWIHLPLVVGADGKRLAKRHGDTRLERYRAAGLRRQRVLGLLGSWLGIGAEGRGEMDLPELLERFDLARMPRTRVVYGAEDEAWLGQATD